MPYGFRYSLFFLFWAFFSSLKTVILPPSKSRNPTHRPFSLTSLSAPFPLLPTFRRVSRVRIRGPIRARSSSHHVVVGVVAGFSLFCVLLLWLVLCSLLL